MTAAREFQVVLDHTHCPFARSSSWQFCEPPGQPTALGDYLAANLALFRACLRQAAARQCDGYILRLPAGLGSDVEGLRRTALAVLEWLGRQSVPERLLTMADLERPDWWFRFDEHQLFVVAFGSCFGESHTRYQFGADGTFIVFQHQQAFARRYPRGIPMELRHHIRELFARAGRTYEYELGVIPGPAGYGGISE